MDALCPKRGSGDSVATERVVNQLLTEMDGLDERRHVFVIAATNRPDIIDKAMLRPGRLDKLLYVPLPTKDDRLSILETLCKNKPISSDVDLKAIAFSDNCQRYSGADMNMLLREASILAIKRTKDDEELIVKMEDFKKANKKVFPSVSKEDEVNYIKIQKTMTW